MGLRIPVMTSISMILCGLAYSLTPPPPVQPPESWESPVLPGFTPSIESVIVANRVQANIQELGGYTKAWGPKCVEALGTLFEDPRWAQFSNQLLNLMAHADYPEMRKWFEDRIAHLASVPAANMPQGEPWQSLRTAMTLDQDRFRPILTRYVENGPPHIRRSSLWVLLSTYDNTWENLAALEKLTRHLGQDPEDENARHAIMEHMRLRKGYLRAEEPMATVLEKEKNGRKREQR